jgi:hypothetical protein
VNVFDDVDPLRALAFPFEQYPENGLVCSCGRPQRVTSDGPICKLGHREVGGQLCSACGKWTLGGCCEERPAPKPIVEAGALQASAVGSGAVKPSAAERTIPLFQESPKQELPKQTIQSVLKPKLRVSHSELHTFHVCPRKWHYAYVLRREARATAEALLVGRRVEVPVKDLLVGVPPKLDDLKVEERALVQAYALRWKGSELEITDVNVPFEVDVHGIVVVGEIDAVGWQHKRRVLMDTKTTSEDISAGSPYWRRITHADPQVTTYLLAARVLGWEAAFMVWDVLRKTQLERHLATPAEKRKYTKPTKAEPTPRLYANQREADETDAEFEVRVLEDIEKRPDWYFARNTIVRYEGEHEAHVRDLKGTVHLMQVVRDMDEPPRNVHSCFQYGSECPYFSVCTGEAKITDDTRFQERKHRPVPAVAEAGRVDEQNPA